MFADRLPRLALERSAYGRGGGEPIMSPARRRASARAQTSQSRRRSSSGRAISNWVSHSPHRVGMSTGSAVRRGILSSGPSPPPGRRSPPTPGAVPPAEAGQTPLPSDLRGVATLAAVADDPLDLTGHAVIVTGGTKGVGRGIAERFRAAGASVVVCARHEPEGPLPDGISFVAADVRDPDDAERAVATAVERPRRLAAPV